ncbi:hypothetical protein HZA96_06690 [Candidatus Woesearchaeota archaeon]|nr:hypothetical protein [Candidatus Woesearchaeota archaeon]
MQITVDTTKDEKEDIQKAIEILNHFLNKQPKTNVVVQSAQQNAPQKSQQSQQASAQSLQQPMPQQSMQMQQPMRLQQTVKPAQQQVPQINLDERKPRNEIQRLDPDLNHSKNNKVSRVAPVQQKASNNDPETEDFLNRMLQEIDKTNGGDSNDNDSDDLEIKEKEVVRVPFGATEIVKRQQQKQQQEDPEFTFEDLEKY